MLAIITTVGLVCACMCVGWQEGEVTDDKFTKLLAFPPVCSPRKSREGGWVERGITTIVCAAVLEPSVHEYLCLCLGLKTCFIKGQGGKWAGYLI